MPNTERIARIAATDLQEPVDFEKINGVLDLVEPPLPGVAARRRIHDAAIERFGHGERHPAITMRWGGDCNTIGRNITAAIIINADTQTPELEVSASAWQGRDEVHEYKTEGFGSAPIPYTREEKKFFRSRLDEAGRTVKEWTWEDLLRARLERQEKVMQRGTELFSKT